MIQQDKFGNQIYYSKFKILIETAKKLQELNYKESFKKQNLFFKKTGEGCMFADMRGTDEVPIWEDTDPLFYWLFNEDIPYWKQRRLIEEEIKIFIKRKCPFRVSFDVHDNPIFNFENYESGSFVDFEGGEFDWENGFCKKCQKDFQDEGSFCAECLKSNNIV